MAPSDRYRSWPAAPASGPTAQAGIDINLTIDVSVRGDVDVIRTGLQGVHGDTLAACPMRLDRL